MSARARYRVHVSPKRTRDSDILGIGVKRGELNERVIHAICMSNGKDPSETRAGRDVKKSSINRGARIASEKKKERERIGIAHAGISFAGYAAALSLVLGRCSRKLLRNYYALPTERPRIIGALRWRAGAGASQTDAGGNR